MIISQQYPAIHPDPGTDLQWILLGAGRDYLLLPLPSLSGAQQFFRGSLPRVAARIEDKRANLIILNADKNLALLPAEPENVGP